METFNVALLSDDTTMKMSYFFKVNANSREEAIQLAQNNLRGIIRGQYGDLSDTEDDLAFIESEVMDFTPEVFELTEI
jgi:hypothetical protein